MNQSRLAQSYAATTNSIAQLMDACYAGAIGERMCEDAVYQLGRIIADLDASSLFVTAGQIKAEEIAPGKDFVQCHSDMLKIAKGIDLLSQNFVQSTLGGSQDEVGKSAKQMVLLGKQLSNMAKATG